MMCSFLMLVIGNTDEEFMKHKKVILVCLVEGKLHDENNIGVVCETYRDDARMFEQI